MQSIIKLDCFYFALLPTGGAQVAWQMDDLKHANAWLNLGTEGGGFVEGEVVTRRPASSTPCLEEDPGADDTNGSHSPAGSRCQQAEHIETG